MEAKRGGERAAADTTIIYGVYDVVEVASGKPNTLQTRDSMSFSELSSSQTPEDLCRKSGI